VIGCHADVRGVPIDHSEHGSHDAAHGADLPPLLIDGGGDRIVVAEELIGAVDEVNIHRR
jgi:hypothetical protein